MKDEIMVDNPKDTGPSTFPYPSLNLLPNHLQLQQLQQSYNSFNGDFDKSSFVSAASILSNNPNNAIKTSVSSKDNFDMKLPPTYDVIQNENKLKGLINTAVKQTENGKKKAFISKFNILTGKDNGSISSSSTTNSNSSALSAYSFQSSLKFGDEVSDKGQDEEMMEASSTLGQDEINRLLKIERSRNARVKTKDSLTELKEYIPTLQGKLRVPTPQLIKETVKHIMALGRLLQSSQDYQTKQQQEIDQLKAQILEHQVLINQSQNLIQIYIQKQQQEFLMNNANLSEIEKSLPLFLLTQKLQQELCLNNNGTFNFNNSVSTNGNLCGNSNLGMNSIDLSNFQLPTVSSSIPVATSASASSTSSPVSNTSMFSPVLLQQQLLPSQFFQPSEVLQQPLQQLPLQQQFTLQQQLRIPQNQSLQVKCPPKETPKIKSVSQPSVNSNPLPQGWEELTDNFQRKFYVNHANKTTTWLDPRRAKNIDRPPSISNSISSISSKLSWPFGSKNKT
ncbi:hypothetical protein HK099_005900 [Clydaea vesicula]|uniref:Uncharacterized protein n=1 Tax=Clydaea vesicula TaxID=447962 RepID=A0AAD5U0Y2_9FUNG|nr:hypothetical protein HK099_005900 [Clydaea vesicula]KAJ3389069.1 hypothetical protein HDU92_001199 [Lobulomyces angularis]